MSVARARAAALRKPQAPNYTGTGTYGYDLADRLTSFKHPFETTTTNLNPDRAGNITTDANGTSTYTNNRLTSRTEDGTTSTFNYDDFGNEKTETPNGSSTATKTTTYDPAGHAHSVTQADGQITYTYDALGRLIKRGDGQTGEITLFFHDRDTDQIVEETNSAGTVQTRYILDSDGHPLANEDDTQVNINEQRGYYIEDLHGNLAQLQDGAGTVKATYSYDVLGSDKPNLTSQADHPNSAKWDSRLRFQLAPQDPRTKDYNIGARLLDPGIGRFLNADQYIAGEANLGLSLDPLTSDRYLYAGSDALNNFDDGHGPTRSSRPQQRRTPKKQQKYGSSPEERRWCRSHKRDCVVVAALSRISLLMTTRHYGGFGGEGFADAYQHVVWSGLLTIRFGENKAREILDRHERAPGQTPEGLAMDTSNNDLGVFAGQAWSMANRSSHYAFGRAARRAMSNAALSFIYRNWTTTLHQGRNF